MENMAKEGDSPVNKEFVLFKRNIKKKSLIVQCAFKCFVFLFGNFCFYIDIFNREEPPSNHKISVTDSKAVPWGKGEKL